jgi:hypothetical protein
MIISHELKIIFLKTKKVAGTSMEIALSKFCGEDDIITPITPPDEKTRQQLGFKIAQNYRNPKWYNYQNGAKISYAQTKGEFFNHIPAIAVRNMVPSKIWNDYLIVSMVHSPFDAIISRYFWEGAERTGLTFEKFVEKNPHFLEENSAITHIANESVVEFYLRYENLEEDVSALELKIGKSGIWNQFRNINAKGNLRPRTGTSAKEYFSKAPQATRIVQSRCTYEIEKFGYSLK